MKNKEELDTIRKEVETLSKKLAELNEDELSLVTGGSPYGIGSLLGGFDIELDPPNPSRQR